jgi:formylglycine-generating enzyme required for sulfatase activity
MRFGIDNESPDLSIKEQQGRSLYCMNPIYIGIIFLSAALMLLSPAFHADAKSAPRDLKPGALKTFDLDGGVSMDFVWCPPGSFMMGSSSVEQDAAIKSLPADLKPETLKSTVNAIGNEGPKHRVTFKKGFWMARTEVTQAQWKQVMGTNPSTFIDSGDSAPVETVSWNDCQIFIGKLNQLFKAQTKGKAGLPTESEWEYACRGGSKSTYSFGDDALKLGDYAWFAGNSSMKTHPVAMKQPNAWGLYDMHGNVWEWCSSFFEKYPDREVTDPRGSLIGDTCVGRGGGWDDFADDLRSAYRSFGRPADFKASPLGVRPVIKE